MKDSDFLPKTQPYIEKKEGGMYGIEVIRNFSDQALKDILEAYKSGMPWHFGDANKYFEAMLKDPRNVHVLLRRKEEPAGYLLAKPHDEAAKDRELIEADPEFKPDPERYYIETAEIVPEVRQTLSGGKMFFRMLHAMIDEVEGRFGKNKFSMHLRIGNGADAAVKKYFGDMVKSVRVIKNWPFYDGKDDADYIEATYIRE